MKKKSLDTSNVKSKADKVNDDILYLTFLAEAQRKFPENFVKEDILRALGKKLGSDV